MDVLIEHVDKRLGGNHVLRDVSLTLPDRQLVALLGPSGSGKTTLLSIIAGLLAPDRGEIVLGGRSLRDLSPRERGIGFVFQNYALFEHMTVGENIGFGLAVRKLERAAIRRRVDELLGLVQLEGLAARLPRELSGGQRQRVALARALAPEPSLLLLDEPFGALDARVRTELRAWLRRLHHELPITSVFVTHDRDEALELADQVVVLHEGRVQQIGTPDEVLDRPANAFVLGFLDDVVELAGRCEGERGRFGPFAFASSEPSGARVRAIIRRRDLELAREASGIERGNAAPAEILEARRVGGQVRVELRVIDLHEPLIADVAIAQWRALARGPGERVHLVVREARVFAAA
ncbi:sulfate/molybdate ABC transporter ATP-binding protein [Nannocystaceae bacterium ST9]